MAKNLPAEFLLSETVTNQNYEKKHIFNLLRTNRLLILPSIFILKYLIRC